MKAILVATALACSFIASAAGQTTSTFTDFLDFDTVQQLADRYRARDPGAIMYLQGFRNGVMTASVDGREFLRRGRQARLLQHRTAD
jgi:hypothetical protein